MPYADAKYPPPVRLEFHVRELMAVLEPFAFLLENPLDFPDKQAEWTIQTVDLQEARLVFCRVAVALRLPGFDG